MNIGTILLGFLVSTLLGAAFHLWKDGGLGRLILYILLSWTGFWIGQILASSYNLAFFDVGPLHLGTAIVMSLLFLVIGHWLSLVKPIKGS